MTQTQQLLYTKAWHKNYFQLENKKYTSVQIVQKSQHARTLVYQPESQIQQNDGVIQKKKAKFYYVNDIDLLPRSGKLFRNDLLYLQYINFPELISFISGHSQLKISNYIWLGINILIDTKSHIVTDCDNRKINSKQLYAFYRNQLYKLFQKQKYGQNQYSKSVNNKKYSLLIPEKEKCSHKYLNQFLIYIQNNEQLSVYKDTVKGYKISNVIEKLLSGVNVEVKWKYEVMSMRFNHLNKKIKSLQFIPYMMDGNQTRFAVPRQILSLYGQKYQSNHDGNDRQPKKQQLAQDLSQIGLTQAQLNKIMNLAQVLYLLNQMITFNHALSTQDVRQKYRKKICELLQIGADSLNFIIDVKNDNSQSQQGNTQQYGLSYERNFPKNGQSMHAHRMHIFSYIIYEIMVCELCNLLSSKFYVEGIIHLQPLDSLDHNYADYDKQSVIECYQFCIFSFGSYCQESLMNQEIMSQRIRKCQYQRYSKMHSIAKNNILSTLLHQFNHMNPRKKQKIIKKSVFNNKKVEQELDYELNLQKIKIEIQKQKHNKIQREKTIHQIRTQFFLHQFYHFMLTDVPIIQQIITKVFSSGISTGNQYSIFDKLRCRLRSIPPIFETVLWPNHCSILLEQKRNILKSCSIVVHNSSILMDNELINKILQMIRIGQATRKLKQSILEDERYNNNQIESRQVIQMGIQQFVERYMYTQFFKSVQLTQNNSRSTVQWSKQQKIKNAIEYNNHITTKKELIQKYLSLIKRQSLQDTNTHLHDIQIVASKYFCQHQTIIRIVDPKLYQLLEADVRDQYKCVAKIQAQYKKYKNKKKKNKNKKNKNKNKIGEQKKIAKYVNMVESLGNIFQNRHILSLFQSFNAIKQLMEVKIEKQIENNIQQSIIQKEKSQHQSFKINERPSIESEQSKNTNMNINKSNRNIAESNNGKNSSKSIRSHKSNRSLSNRSKHTQVEIKNKLQQLQYGRQQDPHQRTRSRNKSLQLNLQISTQHQSSNKNRPRDRSLQGHKKFVPNANFLSPFDIKNREIKFQLSSPSELTALITPTENRHNDSLIISDSSFPNTPQSANQLISNLSPRDNKQILMEIKKQLKEQKKNFAQSQKSDTMSRKSNKPSPDKSSQNYSKNSQSQNQFIQKSQNVEQITNDEFNSFQDESQKILPQWFKNCHHCFNVEFTRKQLFQKCNSNLPTPKPHPQITFPKASRQLLELLQYEDFITYTRKCMDCVQNEQYYGLINNQSSVIIKPLLLAYPKKQYPTYYKQAFNAILKIGLQKNSKKKIHELLNVIIVPLYESYYEQLRQNQQRSAMFDEDSMLANDYQSSYHNALKDEVFLYFAKQISPHKRELFPEKFMLGYLFGLSVLTRYFCPSPNFLYPFTHYLEFNYKKQIQIDSQSLQTQLLESIFTNLLFFISANEGFKRNFIRVFEKFKTIAPDMKKSETQCSGYLYPRDTPITQYEVVPPLKGQKLQLPALKIKLPNEQSFTLPIRNEIIKTIKKKVLNILGFVNYQFVFFLYIRQEDRSFTIIDDKSKAINLYNLQQQSKRKNKSPISIYLRQAYYIPYQIKDVGAVRMIYLNMVMDQQTFPWSAQAYETIVAMSMAYSDFEDLRVKNYMQITNNIKKNQQNMQKITRIYSQIRKSQIQKPQDYEYLLYCRRIDRIYMKCFEKTNDPNFIIAVRPYIIQFYDKKQNKRLVGISFQNIRNVYMADRVVVLEIFTNYKFDKNKINEKKSSLGKFEQIQHEELTQRKKSIERLKKLEQKQQDKPKQVLSARKRPPKPHPRVIKTLTLRNIRKYEQLFKTILFYMNNIKLSHQRS